MTYHRITGIAMCALCLLSIGGIGCAAETRPYRMGFTPWPYAATIEAVNDSNKFVNANGDIVCEQIDGNLPWEQALRGEPYPPGFMSKMEGARTALNRRNKLVLYVAPFNTWRKALLESYSDAEHPASPAWATKRFNDPDVITAYTNYCVWLVGYFRPDYMVVSIESSEYLKNVPAEWDHYLVFSRQVHKELKRRFPRLPLSESVTLHSLLDLNVPDLKVYREKTKALIAEQDFMAVSFYPFALNIKSSADMSKALDSIRDYTTKPIAFVETGQPAETIDIPAFKVKIALTPADQNAYLTTLLKHASKDRYLFLIWWAHRDFDELLKSFPAELKDLGSCWRDIGLLDENGRPRPALATWKRTLATRYMRR